MSQICPRFGRGGTKTASPGDITDQFPHEMSSTRGKLADHVGDYVVRSLEGAVLVTSPGTESSYRRAPIVVERLKLPPWWVEAVIWRFTAIFWFYRLRQSRYRQKTKNRLPLENYRRMALPPKNYCHTLVLPPSPKSLPPKNKKPPTAKKLTPYGITAQKYPHL